jgi:hypothetical protein
MGKSARRAAANNRANQMNPNSPAFQASRASTKAAADNRSNQLNPNSDAYAKSRETSEPSQQWKDEYPGAWVDYTNMQPPGPSPDPPASSWPGLQDKQDEKRKTAEALSRRAASVSWSEFSEILSSAIKNRDTTNLEAVMKGGARLPAKELAEAISRIMVEGPLFVQYHIIPYADASLLVDILLDCDLQSIPSGGPLGPDYARFYLDYIGYYVAQDSSKVLPKLIDALSAGSQERQLRAAELIRKCKDPSLTLPEIHKY